MIFTTKENIFLLTSREDLRFIGGRSETETKLIWCDYSNFDLNPATKTTKNEFFGSDYRLKEKSTKFLSNNNNNNNNNKIIATPPPPSSPVNANDELLQFYLQDFTIFHAYAGRCLGMRK
uniref:Uncharacterized protein n=1 Tax=Glossina austeni TaxID=7395 RepID=A0A1A9VPH2_GLOAU